jgi:ribonuclease HI
MRVVQHNCRKTYPVTIAALEAGLELEVGLVCLQEPYIKREFRHGGYQIFWPEAGLHKTRRVATAIRRDLFSRVIVEPRTDLVNHPYFLVLDIWELDRAGEKNRRTRVINCYDNWLGAGCCWQGDSDRRRRAIEDVSWNEILEGRCLFLGDFNAHSTLWNPLARARANAGPLEDLIEGENLFINNEPGIPTRPKVTPGISIIDLTFTTVSMGPLRAWAVDEDHQTGSDHEMIVMEWASMEHGSMAPSKEVTGWQIQALEADPQTLEATKHTWQTYAEQRDQLSDTCSVDDLTTEAIWAQETLTAVLNQHAKPVRVTPRSKRWWSQEIRDAREDYSQARRAWQAQEIPTDSYHETRNNYYRTIRRAKRACWEAFLGGGPTDLLGQPDAEDTARCWLALSLTKSKTTATTPTLRGPQGQTASTISEKEALIRETAFPPAPGDNRAVDVPEGSWYTEVDEGTVKRALFHQSVQKAPGIDRLNFRALRLLWEWDSPRIVALARQCFRLGVHPRPWKTAKGILLRKPNKPDYTLVKAYRVISLLNCIGKVIEKIAAEAISTYCETTGKLHRGQMGSRKQRNAIDAVACLIQSTHEAWRQKQLMGALFMDVKGAFDHVNPGKLVARMIELGLDGDLVRWVQSFLTDRQVQLNIDNMQCPAQDINSGVPQGSPVSPILFLIYLSGVFDVIERAVPGVRPLSFADDIALLVPGCSVQEVCSKLQDAAEVAIEWGQSNLVQFEAEKTEAVLFTRKRGKELRDQVQRARIVVENHQVSFNREATRWLGIWLDAGLSLKAHYETCLRKARNAEARVQSLCQAQGLPPGLARRIQVAAVQSVALFGAELWWRGQKDRLDGIQTMINRQARAVTGMLKTTPVGPLVKEAGLAPAEILLEARQLNYTTRLLGLPDDNPAKGVLPTSFREGDQYAQPGEQTPGNRTWAETQGEKPWSLGQHLARQLASIVPADPSDGFESLQWVARGRFPGQVKVQSSEEALAAALAIQSDQAIWSDGSRLENGRTGAGVAWQDPNGTWKTRGFPLGSGHEVFDAELLGVIQALRIAKRTSGNKPITILLDSQAAIARLRHTRAGAGQSFALQAHAIARDLQAQGRELTIQWVPGHAGIEGNEKADQVAKEAATKPGSIPGGLSLAFTRRACTEIVKARKQGWLTQALAKRSLQNQRAYRPHKGWKLDPAASRAPKQVASRYYQLKSGHAAIGAHLHQIQRQESPECRRCRAPRETVHHLLFECREWRHQRAKLYTALDRAGIARPSAAEECPEGRLLGEPKATRAILEFLATTSAGLPLDHAQRTAERAQQDDERGLEELDDADRTGEG